MYKSGTVPRTSFDHFGLCLFSLRNSLIYTTAVPPRLSIYHKYQSFISNTTGFDNVIHMADRVNDHGFTLRYHCDRSDYTISSAEALLTTSNLSRAVPCLGVSNMERYFCSNHSRLPEHLVNVIIQCGALMADTLRRIISTYIKSMVPSQKDDSSINSSLTGSLTRAGCPHCPQ